MLMKNYIIATPLLCTTLTTAACFQDSIVGEWELDDFDVDCQDSITQYTSPYGETINVDTSTCVDSFDLEFVIDRELEGAINKYKASASRTYSYNGSTSEPYVFSVNAEGDIEVDKKENSYDIAFEISAEASYNGQTEDTEVDWELECELTSKTELECESKEGSKYEFKKSD